LNSPELSFSFIQKLKKRKEKRLQNKKKYRKISDLVSKNMLRNLKRIESLMVDRG
jgi:hypothetical protein